MRVSRIGRRLASLAASAVTAACAAGPGPSAYTPRERDFVVTAVPLLTKEMASVCPFLREDFAAGVARGFAD